MRAVGTVYKNGLEEVLYVRAISLLPLIGLLLRQCSHHSPHHYHSVSPRHCQVKYSPMQVITTVFTTVLPRHDSAPSSPELSDETLASAFVLDGVGPLAPAATPHSSSSSDAVVWPESGDGPVLSRFFTGGFSAAQPLGVP